MKYKTGPLTAEEKEFIIKNAHSMDSTKLSIELSRRESVIKRFCKQNAIALDDVPKKQSRKQEELTEEQYEEFILRQKLDERPYWVEIKNQMTDKEITYFADTWVRIMKQFKENILYSEELQVKQWITLEVMGNRVMRDRKMAQEQIERLDQALSREYGKDIVDRSPEVIAQLETEIAMVRNSLSSYTTEHSKILDRIGSIQKELKAARSDRVKKVEDSKTSFAGLIKALEDEEYRKRMGEDMEMARIAKDVSKEQLGEYHTYIDGTIDQPLLNADTLKEDQ